MTNGRSGTQPQPLDLELATLVRRALGAVDTAGRFGPRKVFISALWVAMLRIDAAAVGRLASGDLAAFKRWLVAAQQLNGSESERTPLVVLARADLVAAMDGALVADSETLTDGASYHFVLDPAAAPDAYEPPPRCTAPPASRSRQAPSARPARTPVCSISDGRSAHSHLLGSTARTSLHTPSLQSVRMH